MGLADRIKRQAKDQEEPKKGKSYTQYDVIEVFLNSKWDFRYNVILDREEFKPRGKKQWQELTDREAKMMLRQARHTGIKCSKALLDETIGSDFSPKYDPFDLYFSSLPTHDPSKPSAIKALADTISLDDEAQRPRFELYLKRWLIGLVGTATNPNTYNELILVLIGNQSDGKTRWFRRLVPDALEEYQYTGMVKTDDKDSKILLCECLLVNLDEMATLRKNDIEGVKSFASEHKIRVRRSYDKRAKTLTRRASLCGSDNEDTIISDPSGSRRFLIFKTKSANHQHTVDIDQVYAEALHLFHQGERYWLEKDEVAELNEANKQFAVITAEEDLVDKYFTDGDGFYSTTEILRVINTEEAKQGRSITLPTNQATLKKIGGACKKLGFERKARKVDGKVRYGYTCSERFAQSSDSFTNAPF